MSTPPHARARVLDALSAISRGGESKALTQRLRQALLDLGSETPDNKAMVTRLQVGQTEDQDAPSFGPFFAESGALMADFAWAVEDLPMPEDLKQRFPGLSQADWDAYTRFCTLIMSALTQPRADP